MKCLVTAGPSYEPLDQVRRLTNFSTGQLGTELADFLVEQGREVILLRSALAVAPLPKKSQQLHPFSTSADLARRLEQLQSERFDAVFHAAAVADFSFGKIWERAGENQLIQLSDGKLPSRTKPLLAELIPAPKILPRLRSWFPQAFLVGWKYEVDGDRPSVLDKAAQQIQENQTDACVANGPAYGPGFGLVLKNQKWLTLLDRPSLFQALLNLLH